MSKTGSYLRVASTVTIAEGALDVGCWVAGVNWRCWMGIVDVCMDGAPTAISDARRGGGVREEVNADGMSGSRGRIRDINERVRIGDDNVGRIHYNCANVPEPRSGRGCGAGDRNVRVSCGGTRMCMCAWCEQRVQ